MKELCGAVAMNCDRCNEPMIEIEQSAALIAIAGREEGARLL